MRWPWQVAPPGLIGVASLDADRLARTITITFAESEALERFWGWLIRNSCQAREQR